MCMRAPGGQKRPSHLLELELQVPWHVYSEPSLDPLEEMGGIFTTPLLGFYYLTIGYL